ncbi:MAG: M48 family metallopeptidase [Gammaproteobacteria bacterium]
MPVNPQQLAFDFSAPTIRYEVLHSHRRRTLGLEVHRDLRVVIRAPVACPDELVARYLARNKRWISRQLAQFQSLPAPRPRRRYIAGETHLYLGTEYPLRLRPEGRSRVVLEDEALAVYGIGAMNPTATESALARWYLARAKVEFHAVVAACHAHPRFAGYPQPRLTIRTMRTRWGTLCAKRGMTLNSVLIQAAPECIEYVVCHELCHLRYRGHGRRFHQLLSAVLPDWEARKQRLEATLP